MQVKDELYSQYRLHYLMCRQTLDRLKEGGIVTDIEYKKQLDLVSKAPDDVENALPYLKQILEHLRKLYKESYDVSMQQNPD